MNELSTSVSLSALYDELQSMAAETFEIQDHVDVGADLAAVPHCSCACSVPACTCTG